VEWCDSCTIICASLNKINDTVPVTRMAADRMELVSEEKKDAPSLEAGHVKEIMSKEHEWMEYENVDTIPETSLVADCVREREAGSEDLGSVGNEYSNPPEFRLAGDDRELQSEEQEYSFGLKTTVKEARSHESGYKEDNEASVIEVSTCVTELQTACSDVSNTPNQTPAATESRPNFKTSEGMFKGSGDMYVSDEFLVDNERSEEFEEDTDKAPKTHKLAEHIKGEKEVKNLEELLYTIWKLENSYKLETEHEEQLRKQDQDFLDLMRKYDLREVPMCQELKEASSTMEIYIQKIRHSGLPWLHEKYPGLNMMWLVDFAGYTEKPKFKGKEGYHKRDKCGPFRLSAEDIRENIKDSYNLVSSPAVSKLLLFYAWNKVIEVSILVIFIFKLRSEVESS
jgi:hypothetical protein